MPNHDIETLQTAVATRKPLHSIFDRVDIKKHEFKKDRRSELPRSELTANGFADTAGFPALTDAALQADLNRLAQNLRPNAHADTLPYLFQKYGWRIADSADPDKYPDAALCDTFRADRALAKAGPTGGYLLVKGDLTGIQEYIYNGIQPKQAGGLGNLSKRLRARSVLVSLLTDFIANVILRELGLESWHLLFAGGGHFNLLLPDDRKDDLGKLSKDISAALRHQFGERLELIVAEVECSADELRDHASRCFEKVNAKRDELKYRQHLGGLSGLFQEKIEGGQQKKDEREDRERRIGGDFPKQKHLLETVSKEPFRRQYDNLALAKFDLKNFSHRLFAVKTREEAKEILSENEISSIQSAHILRLNSTTDFLPTDDWQSDFAFPVSFGFRFLGKNAPRPKPLDEKGKEIESAEEIEDVDLLDFGQIAEIGQEDRQKGEGFLRLGSLMLDVDDLGLIFSNGLVGATLPRIIALSRELNYFFTAHFDERARQHRVYVVYSGGDDAFAVGKWDMLIRFAKVLREDFQKFICYEENKNPDVHFSAGLFMSNPYYPIGRFYRDVKVLQNDKAKKVEEKNSLDVFDHTLGWGSFEDKIRLGDLFREVLEKGQTESGRKFSASFAYRIMQLVKTSYYERDEMEGGKLQKRGVVKMGPFARNVMRMRNLFARNGFKEADIAKLTNDLEKELTVSFLKAFNFDAPHNARDYLVALHFAMLQVRSKTKTPTAHG